MKCIECSQVMLLVRYFYETNGVSDYSWKCEKCGNKLNQIFVNGKKFFDLWG